MAGDGHITPDGEPIKGPAGTVAAEAEASPDPDLDSPFKRRLALAVAVLALAAGALGWAATDASIRSGEISRRANTDSIKATMQETSANVDAFTQFGIYSTVSDLRSRRDLGTIQRELLGAAAGTVPPEEWEAARAQLARLTPLLQPGRLQGRPDLLATELFEGSNTNRLAYEAEKRHAGAWDRKASLYIGGVTLLGVATTLLGLALTVPAGSRRYLVGAAGTVAAVTAVGAVVVAVRPAHGLPSGTVALVARGDRLVAERKFADAVDAYDAAIERTQEFVPAYSGRAFARMIRDSPQRDLALFAFSSTSPEARRAAIADLAHGLRLDPHDYLMLLNQGANYFHVRDYARTVAYSRRAIAENPDLPLPWMNAALGLAGEGRDAEARETLAAAITKIRARPLAVERGELYATARGTMAMLGEQRPDLRRVVRSLQEQITAAESADLLPLATDAAEARVTKLELTATGEILRASYSYTGLPPGSRLAWIAYHRTRPRAEWIERSSLDTFEVSRGPVSGSGGWSVFDGACAGGGEYRVDLYSGGRFLASSTLVQRTRVRKLLTPTYDLSGSMIVCRPRAWKQVRSTSWAADVQSGNGRARISVRVLPLVKPPADDAARLRLIDAVLDRLGNAVGGTPAAADGLGTIGYWSGSERRIDRGGNRRATVWVSLAADSVVRTVTIRYDAADEATIHDLRDRIYLR